MCSPGPARRYGMGQSPAATSTSASTVSPTSAPPSLHSKAEGGARAMQTAGTATRQAEDDASAATKSHRALVVSGTT